MKKGTLILSGVLGLSLIALVLLIVIYAGKQNSGAAMNNPHPVFSDEPTTVAKKDLPEWTKSFVATIEENYLPVNKYSRPGDELSKVNAVVIHYVANPNTTAAQNRSYFSNLKDSKATYASSHFIVGLDGEIINCVPLNEIAYASNSRNLDTISIENCHPDETGKFKKETYESTVKLTAYLCLLYGLNPYNDIIRHYDITGKACPKYFVENEDEWLLFKADVDNYMKTEK